KTNNDVASIIAGDGVCICDECVFACVNIIFKQNRRARNGEKNIKA
ncbi:ClpX C4-type zinc finger protein, partial [Salmonella enterica]